MEQAWTAEAGGEGVGIFDALRVPEAAAPPFGWWAGPSRAMADMW
jgi:hypothetical protein